MLRYMLYECNADTVSLKKEVLMLQHYIGPKKYGMKTALISTLPLKASG